MANPSEEPEKDPAGVDAGKIENLRARTSVGKMSDEHWTRARKDLNAEALEYYRQRDAAPGVADCDAPRNHYCMECDGVIPLEYDSRKAHGSAPPEHCPHCGAELSSSVRRMFNWVEIDQVHGSDLRALMPWFAAVFAGVALLVWWLV